MREPACRRRAAVSILVSAVLLVCGKQAQASQEIRAGASRKEFHFSRKVPLAGFSRRRGKPAEGLRDPVGVSAMVLESPDTRLILASCDLLVVDETLYQAVWEDVRQRLSDDKDTVLFLAATHTHSGPGAYGTRFLEKISMGHFDPRVFEELTQRIVEAIADAAEPLVPVRMAYGLAETEGLVRNRIDAAGEVDSQIGVAAFKEAGQSAPLAVWINFSAHPTTLGAWNRNLSADYPGAACRAIKAVWPSTHCLFFAGAVADQAPVKQGQGDEPVLRLGRQLADTAVRLIRNGAFSEIRRLRAHQQVVALDRAQVRIGSIRLPQWFGRRLVDNDATLSLAAVGPLMIAGAPCDMTAALGRRVKESIRNKRQEAMLAGFVNDYIGYCIPPGLYPTEAYESRMAFNGPDTGLRIVERLIEMADGLAEHEK